MRMRGWNQISYFKKFWNWKSKAISRWTFSMFGDSDSQHQHRTHRTRNKNHRVIWLVYILYFGQNQQSTLALFYWCDYYWWCLSINFAVNNNKTKTNTNFRFSQISSWYSSFSVFRRHFLIFHMEITRFGKCNCTYS